MADFALIPAVREAKTFTKLQAFLLTSEYFNQETLCIENTDDVNRHDNMKI